MDSLGTKWDQLHKSHLEGCREKLEMEKKISYQDQGFTNGKLGSMGNFLYTKMFMVAICC